MADSFAAQDGIVGKVKTGDGKKDGKGRDGKGDQSLFPAFRGKHFCEDDNQQDQQRRIHLLADGNEQEAEKRRDTKIFQAGAFIHDIGCQKAEKEQKQRESQRLGFNACGIHRPSSRAEAAQ